MVPVEKKSSGHLSRWRTNALAENSPYFVSNPRPVKSTFWYESENPTGVGRPRNHGSVNETE